MTATERAGIKPLLTVTEAQACSLQARGLVTFAGRARVTHAILQPGISVASCNAALREGAHGRLPSLPSTVKHVDSPAGGYYTLSRVGCAVWGIEVDGEVSE